MVSIWVKTWHTAKKYINKSVYLQHNKSNLVSLILERLLFVRSIYVGLGSCSQLAAILHCHISKEARQVSTTSAIYHSKMWLFWSILMCYTSHFYIVLGVVE